METLTFSVELLRYFYFALAARRERGRTSKYSSRTVTSENETYSVSEARFCAGVEKGRCIGPPFDLKRAFPRISQIEGRYITGLK